MLNLFLIKCTCLTKLITVGIINCYVIGRQSEHTLYPYTIHNVLHCSPPSPHKSLMLVSAGSNSFLLHRIIFAHTHTQTSYSLLLYAYLPSLSSLTSVKGTMCILTLIAILCCLSPYVSIIKTPAIQM